MDDILVRSTARLAIAVRGAGRHVCRRISNNALNQLRGMSLGTSIDDAAASQIAAGTIVFELEGGIITSSSHEVGAAASAHVLPSTPEKEAVVSNEPEAEAEDAGASFQKRARTGEQ